MTIFKVSKFPLPTPSQHPPPTGDPLPGHQGTAGTRAGSSWGVNRWGEVVMGVMMMMEVVVSWGDGLPGDAMGRTRLVFGVGGGPG